MINETNKLNRVNAPAPALIVTNDDKEVVAISTINAVMNTLDNAEKKRVIGWVVEQYSQNRFIKSIIRQFDF